MARRATKWRQVPGCQVFGIAFHATFVRSAESRLIRYYAPNLDETRREIVSTTVLWLLTGMLAAAESHASPMREHLLEETKRVLKLYAEDYLGTDT